MGANALRVGQCVANAHKIGCDGPMVKVSDRMARRIRGQLGMALLLAGFIFAAPHGSIGETKVEGTQKTMPVLRAGAPRAVLRPKARNEALPHARWAHRPEAALWTRSALAALKDHGKPLVTMIPRDIANWCPAYPLASPEERAAFWVGFMSALTKHESTYKPRAVGGGGLWYGLLQILPATARGYKCRARSGEALKNGSANLSCAIRIMALTVPRDGVIHAYTKAKKRRWRGVSADWGPMRSAKKRRDMAGWLKQQSYCTPLSSVRPRARPALSVGASGSGAGGLGDLKE